MNVGRCLAPSSHPALGVRGALRLVVSRKVKVDGAVCHLAKKECVFVTLDHRLPSSRTPRDSGRMVATHIKEGCCLCQWRYWEE